MTTMVELLSNVFGVTLIKIEGEMFDVACCIPPSL